MLLEEQGAQVVGVDLRDAQVIADLSTLPGRHALVEGVRLAFGDAIDAAISCACGGGSSESIVRVCYFGAVATLSDLRPFLAKGKNPRAAVVSSVVALNSGDLNAAADPGPDPTLVSACLDGDEDAAVAYCDAGAPAPFVSYVSAKRALSRWVRRKAVLPQWAGAGIALNAVAPGVIDTPLTGADLARPEVRDLVLGRQPFGGIGEPEHVAALLAWLTSPTNRFVTGQLIMVDGGYDAVTRGDDVW